MFLDYEKLDGFLERYFGSVEDREARLVGVDRSLDSGYFDIVRFFGDNKINPEEVEIRYLSGQYKLSDSRIRKYAARIELLLRQQERLYDGPKVMRLASANLSKPPYSLSVQVCDYGTFAGCCFALDQPDPLFDRYGGTLREYYKKKVPLSALESHPLALCLGICGMVVTEEQSSNCKGSQVQRHLLLMHRSENLASLENSVGPSAAGSVDFSTSCRNLSELSKWSLSQEIREELGLQEHEFTIKLLAYAREIFRGERPQLFCLIRTSLSMKELSFRLQSLRHNAEFDSFEFIEMSDNLIDSLYKVRANYEAAMNCLLLEEFFSES
ncbi:MAG: hypothetical protein DRP47_02085 [Candidatus Zixiibacteriota bacterium]|nr:MAG: hypothetical protein DRP47_02085 [candidate division Zixibacteria bacterium]